MVAAGKGAAFGSEDPATDRCSRCILEIGLSLLLVLLAARR